MDSALKYDQQYIASDWAFQSCQCEFEAQSKIQPITLQNQLNSYVILQYYT